MVIIYFYITFSKLKIYLFCKKIIYIKKEVYLFLIYLLETSLISNILHIKKNI